MLSALVRAVIDSQEREQQRLQRWGYSEELLARIAELIHNLTLVVVDVSPAKWATGRPDPLQITRPGEKPRNVVSMGDMARRLTRR